MDDGCRQSYPEDHKLAGPGLKSDCHIHCLPDPGFEFGDGAADIVRQMHGAASTLLMPAWTMREVAALLQGEMNHGHASGRCNCFCLSVWLLGTWRLPCAP